MSKETGGSAFPQASYNMKGGYDITGGMTLRDYFAAKAMAVFFDSDAGHDLIGCQTIAKEAYAMADAMLKEREK